jgi:hypothetical protein
VKKTPISINFRPISLVKEDIYADWVSGSYDPADVSSICTFRDMGFFMYRGCISLKGSSGTSGSEA